MEKDVDIYLHYLSIYFPVEEATGNKNGQHTQQSQTTVDLNKIGSTQEMPEFNDTESEKDEKEDRKRPAGTFEKS
jgi:hypothetical protein